MGVASIPVDLLNPGQVFACLGLLEAAEVLCGPAEGGFAWDEASRFDLVAEGARNPVVHVLEFLADAEVMAVMPKGEDVPSKFGIANAAGPAKVFPRREPKLDILPAKIIAADGRSIELSYWADDDACGRDNAKFWGGAAGYSGAARARDLLMAYRKLDADQRARASADPCNVAAPLSNGFASTADATTRPSTSAFRQTDMPTSRWSAIRLPNCWRPWDCRMRVRCA